MCKEQREAAFKEIMGNYPTGVTIVTTTDSKGNPVGLTVNSFASVSLDPLLILWSIDHKVSSIDSFTEGEHFAVHILAGNQQELCKTFASKNTDRFSQCKWSLSENKLPIIEEVYSVLQCKRVRNVEAGDHTILIGEVTDIKIEQKDPMLYHRRHFGKIPEEFYPVKQS